MNKASTQELREAFVAGAHKAFSHMDRNPGPYFSRNWMEYAAEAYPTPMKTVPRELRIATRTYFIKDGDVWFRTGSGDTIRSNDFNDRSTPQLVSMGYAGSDLASIMDLIINPTQEIEA